MILNTLQESIKENTVFMPNNQQSDTPIISPKPKENEVRMVETLPAPPQADTNEVVEPEITYIHLNDEQLLVNKTAKTFRSTMRVVSMLYLISVTSLFLFYLHIGFDLNVFKGRTPHIFGFLCVFFIYASVATNNFITYLSIGNGKFNKELLVSATYESTLKDCCGQMNVLKTFSHAGLVSGLVILMMCSAYVAFLNSLAQNTTLLSLVFIVGFIVFGVVPTIIHFINYRLSSKNYQVLKTKQAAQATETSEPATETP